MDVEIELDVGTCDIDGGARAFFFAESIADRVFYHLRGEQAMAECGACHVGVDGESFIERKDAGPGDVVDAIVELLTVSAGELRERPEDACGKARSIVDPVDPFDLTRYIDAGWHLPSLGNAHLLDLFEEKGNKCRRSCDE